MSNTGERDILPLKRFKKVHSIYLKGEKMTSKERKTVVRREPNVLLIVADQHRFDCVGKSGQYPVSTPNLDRLADEGVWCSDAFTPIPLCTPARQSLLTGVRAENTGGLWNYDLGSRIPALDPATYAWPRALSERGYRTQYIGKWHVNPDYGPTAFGYDSWVALEDYDAWREAAHPGKPLSADWFGGIDLVATADSRTHWMADRAGEFIRDAASSGSPWHLRLDFLEPHLPCSPSSEFAERNCPEDLPRWRNFDDSLLGKPYIQKQQLLNWEVEGWDWEDWAPIVARYYAVIEQLDDAIGLVLQHLDAAGAEEQTIVIYTSDHGDLGGSHGMMDKHYVMYDEVVRVPLIVRWPERLESRMTNDSFIYNMLDLGPTICEATGAESPPLAHGVPIFDEEDGVLTFSRESAEREHVVSTYNGQQFGLFSQRMLRTRSWKYVWNLTDVDELYDLENDPEELVNRVDDENAVNVLADLRIRLLTHLQEVGDSIVDNVWMARQLATGRKLGNMARGKRTSA